MHQAGQVERRRGSSPRCCGSSSCRRPLMSSFPGGGRARRSCGLCPEQACAMGDTGRKNHLDKAPGSEPTELLPPPLQDLLAKTQSALRTQRRQERVPTASKNDRNSPLHFTEASDAGSGVGRSPGTYGGATEQPACPAGLRPDSPWSGAPASPALTCVLESGVEEQPHLKTRCSCWVASMPHAGGT